MADIIIIGAGGFAREVYYWAKAAFSPEEYRIKGFLSDYPDDLTGFGNIHVPILGSILEYDIQENDRFIYAIGSIEHKRELIDNLKQRGAQFINLIHPTALVLESANMGEGVILCPFCLISDHVILGDFVMLNSYASVGHDAVIGDYSILCPYSAVLGWASVGEESFLGIHSTVVARKCIGNRVQVSANSSVQRNVPDGAFVLGVPGKTTL